MSSVRMDDTLSPQSRQNMSTTSMIIRNNLVRSHKEFFGVKHPTTDQLGEQKANSIRGSVPKFNLQMLT